MLGGPTNRRWPTTASESISSASTVTSSSTGSAPRRQTKTLARLRDDLHLVALEHASNVVAWYDCAEELPIPDQVGDRLRDILELLFAIAAAADAERGACRAIMKAARAIRNPHRGRCSRSRAGGGADALEGICEPNGRGIVISAGGPLSLFREAQGLGWVDSKEKARGLLRLFGLRSAIHRRALLDQGAARAPLRAHRHRRRSGGLRDRVR